MLQDLRNEVGAIVHAVANRGALSDHTAKNIFGNVNYAKHFLQGTVVGFFDGHAPGGKNAIWKLTVDFKMPSDVAPGPTSSNCSLVLTEIARLEAFFAGNATSTKLEGILLPSKRLRKVGFVAGPTSPASSTSDSSTIISIGSELEPDFALDADGSDLCDVPPLSA